MIIIFRAKKPLLLKRLFRVFYHYPSTEARNIVFATVIMV